MKIATEYYDTHDMTIPGYTADIDVLSVGLDSFTEDQQRVQFALLCFFQSPLFISCDLRSISEASMEILSNRELIAIDQDKACLPPRKIQKNLECYSFFRHLDGGEYAIGFFNLGEHKVHIPCEFYLFGIHETTGVKFDMTDVVSGRRIEKRDDGWGEDPEPYTFKVYRMKITEKPE